MGLERIVADGGCPLRRLGLLGEHAPLTCVLEKVMAYLASYLMVLFFLLLAAVVEVQSNFISRLNTYSPPSELVRRPLIAMFTAVIMALWM